MHSVRIIYKIGKGPSSSHSMAPAKAASLFLAGFSVKPSRVEVVLYGSLAATGKGHLTDAAIVDSFGHIDVDIHWQPNKTLSEHPNAMDFIAFDDEGGVIKKWQVYSVGGGQLCDNAGPVEPERTIDYPADSFDDILRFCNEGNIPIWKYIDKFDDDSIWPYLESCWQSMKESVERGLSGEGVLPGSLKLERRAKVMLECADIRVDLLRDRNLLSAYALAVAEENASGHTIVTAPTCGSCGIIPAVLYFFWRHYNMDIVSLTRALGVAGLIGSTVIARASISGAEVGCQGEVGASCAMAAGAATFLLRGSNSQIEYAAEMGLEHFLGLTCDPIDGLVQVPCIERNAFAAMRAMDCAAYALATVGGHIVSLDNVIDVMNDTGRDLQSKYRETARGGLAAIMRDKLQLEK